MALPITDTLTDEADAYFSTRLNSAAWTGSDEETQKAALVTAANLFNAMDWLGRPATSLSAFPRYYQHLRAPITPLQIKWALFEQAIHLLANPGLLIEEDSVESIVLGPVELTTLVSVELIPKIVKRYISNYTGSNVSAGWWRAN